MWRMRQGQKEVRHGASQVQAMPEEEYGMCVS